MASFHEARSITSPDVMQALNAFCRAEYTKAAALLQGSRERGAAALRARIAVRHRQPILCIKEYERALATISDARELAEVSLAAGVSYDNLGDTDSADVAFASAARLAKQLNNSVLDAHVKLVRGVVLSGRLSPNYERDFIDDTIHTLDRAPAVESDPAFFIEPNHVRGNATHLLAALTWHEGDAPGGINLLCEALLTQKLVRRRDLGTEITTAFTIAKLGCFDPAKNPRELLTLWAQDTDWNAGLDNYRSGIRRAFQVQNYLYGYSAEPDLFGGHRFASVGERLGFFCDQLIFANWDDIGDYDSHMAEIEAIIKSPEWIPDVYCSDDLFWVAFLVASRNPTLAVNLLTKYNLTNFQQDQVRGFFGAKLMGILRHMTLGVVAKHEENPTLATYHLESAYQRSDFSIGIPCSALIGIELYTVSRNPVHLEAARRFAAEWPHTAFTIRLNSAIANAEHSGRFELPYLRRPR